MCVPGSNVIVFEPPHGMNSPRGVCGPRGELAGGGGVRRPPAAVFREGVGGPLFGVGDGRGGGLPRHYCYGRGSSVGATERTLVPSGLRVFADGIAAANAEIVDRLAAGVAARRDRRRREAGAGEAERAISTHRLLDGIDRPRLGVGE